MRKKVKKGKKAGSIQTMELIWGILTLTLGGFSIIIFTSLFGVKWLIGENFKWFIFGLIFSISCYSLGLIHIYGSTRLKKSKKDGLRIVKIGSIFSILLNILGLIMYLSATRLINVLPIPIAVVFITVLIIGLNFIPAIVFLKLFSVKEIRNHDESGTKTKFKFKKFALVISIIIGGISVLNIGGRSISVLSRNNHELTNKAIEIINKTEEFELANEEFELEGFVVRDKGFSTDKLYQILSIQIEGKKTKGNLKVYGVEEENNWKVLRLFLEENDSTFLDLLKAERLSKEEYFDIYKKFDRKFK